VDTDAGCQTGATIGPLVRGIGLFSAGGWLGDRSVVFASGSGSVACMDAVPVSGFIAFDLHRIGAVSASRSVVAVSFGGGGMDDYHRMDS